jgi:REP element-mobilizing transposase RayT
MPRAARKKSESGYYHVILRGIGKQILFEDEEDNERFLTTLQRYRLELGFELVAYCLMENHVHLLLHDNRDQLDQIMKKIAGSYAYYFNHKYDRSGHLFQDRYGSEAIEDDAYLLTVIRYIHRNPEKAGIGRARDYRWSSYSAYMKQRAEVDNAWALELIGGCARFESFMAKAEEGNCLDIHEKAAMRDEVARKKICEQYGVPSGTRLQQWEKKERDEALKKLKDMGMSVRQLERLTGINRGIIQKAGRSAEKVSREPSP